jgi:hypothetical protein
VPHLLLGSPSDCISGEFCHAEPPDVQLGYDSGPFSEQCRKCCIRCSMLRCRSLHLPCHLMGLRPARAGPLHSSGAMLAAVRLAGWVAPLLVWCWLAWCVPCAPRPSMTHVLRCGQSFLLGVLFEICAVATVHFHAVSMLQLSSGVLVASASYINTPQHHACCGEAASQHILMVGVVRPCALVWLTSSCDMQYGA